ncbi:MAG: hypothetical protein RL367_2778 [Pseudomonadota bacterium]
MESVSLLGFGEAGMTFASAACWAKAAQVFDIKTTQAETRDAKLADYQVAGLRDAGCANALDGLVLSLVTADQALLAAQSVAKPGLLFCDMNSVAPQTKQAAAAVIAAAGGRYVDVAIMSPVNPAQLAVPLLVSGPHAQAGHDALAGLGFSNIRSVGADIGRASTIKMLRSVMYKGVEALTAECLIACAQAGVTDEVLGSFGNDWATGADYRIDRMMVHGVRRSAEMAEVVKTLQGLGVDPLMTQGTVARQRMIGELAVLPVPQTLTGKLERLT